jgi:hypothetical protein
VLLSRDADAERDAYGTGLAVRRRIGGALDQWMMIVGRRDVERRQSRLPLSATAPDAETWECSARQSTAFAFG